MSSDSPSGGAPAGEREPDYRFTLANERTFLAWLRTALALDAAGIAVVHLLPQLLVPGVRELAGVSLVVLGAVVAGGAYSRWQRYQQALRHGRPLPPSRLPAVLVIVLTVVSVLSVALLVVESAAGP
jgi:putative membrane protein